ncbi:hypothetical protein Tco_1470025 [Tanacetum coccineum]
MKQDYCTAKGGDPDVDTIRRESPSNVEQSDEEAQINFWLDPKRAHRAAVNDHRTQNTIFTSHGSRSLAVTRHQYAELLSQVGSWGENGLGSGSGGESGEVRIREGGSGKGGSDSGDDNGK